MADKAKSKLKSTVTDRMKRAVQAAAEASGESVAEIIRYALVRELRDRGQWPPREGGR